MKEKKIQDKTKTEEKALAKELNSKKSRIKKVKLKIILS